METTAKCNLYCPMCPRETHKQPKEDMTEEIFNRPRHPYTQALLGAIPKLPGLLTRLAVPA